MDADSNHPRAALPSVRRSRSSGSIQLRAIQGLLALAGQPGTSHPDETLFSFHVDDDHEAAIDRATGDQAVIELAPRPKLGSVALPELPFSPST